MRSLTCRCVICRFDEWLSNLPFQTVFHPLKNTDLHGKWLLELVEVGHWNPPGVCGGFPGNQTSTCCQRDPAEGLEQAHRCIVGSLKEISEAGGVIKAELWMLLQRCRVETGRCWWWCWKESQRAKYGVSISFNVPKIELNILCWIWLLFLLHWFSSHCYTQFTRALNSPSGSTNCAIVPLVEKEDEIKWKQNYNRIVTTASCKCGTLSDGPFF